MQCSSVHKQQNKQSMVLIASVHARVVLRASMHAKVVLTASVHTKVVPRASMHARVVLRASVWVTKILQVGCVAPYLGPQCSNSSIFSLGFLQH